jgi:hypothetical protein
MAAEQEEMAAAEQEEMAAEQEDMLDLKCMSEAELRQWVDANPGRVNDRDKSGKGTTPLFVAALWLKSMPLVLWLLDKKGADVNAIVGGGFTVIFTACPLKCFSSLFLTVARTLPCLTKQAVVHRS